jgi:uncharacterized protein YutE (UPF0331/DUF86 family)
MEILKKASGLSLEDFLKDRIIQLATERSLQIAAQSVIDISTHLVAHNHWGTPKSYKDSVDIISKNGVIDSNLAARLIDLVKLRNVIVHVYLEIDPKIIHKSAEYSVDDLKKFIEAIKKIL